MIRKWFNLPEERRREIFNQTSKKAALLPQSIEKDWWTTMVLKSVFELDFSDQIVFKGGTSLSKGWNLIQRLSEDIDVAINMNFLGYAGDPTLKTPFPGILNLSMVLNIAIPNIGKNIQNTRFH